MKLPKARDTNYLRLLKKEFNQVCSDNNLSSSDLEDILDDFFVFFKESIQDFRMPSFKITNLGTFKPRLGKIRKSLLRAFYHYNRGELTREQVVVRINRLWPVKQRLIQERMNIPTWRKWRNKKKAADLWDPLYYPLTDETG